jgi:hypothetical protein
MVKAMDSNQLYQHLYGLLYGSLVQTLELINSLEKNRHDGLFIVVITPEILVATLSSYEGEYSGLKEEMYELAGIDPERITSDSQPLQMSIDPRSFNYLKELYQRGSSVVDPDFYVRHGRKDNPWHDGALVYVLDPETQELRLVAVSVFLYPLPELFEIRSDGNVHGGRYQAAKKISGDNGVIATAIIETNGENGYTLHIFANGKEITDYARTLYEKR